MLHEHVTPSGCEIAFEDGEPGPDGRSKRRCYVVDGEKLPSVTTVLGILEKPGLTYSAEKLTVAACLELAEAGELPQNVDGTISRLKSRELRFFQQWGKKADRGTVSHDDLLKLATGEELPDLSTYSPEHRGFIRGVAAWFADYRPEVIETEQMVASKIHGFSGRFDLLCRLGKLGGEAVYRIDLKTQERIQRYKSGDPKPPYDESLLQLEGYELAAVESGYGASDYRAVLRVESSGAYDFTISWAESRQFLAVLDAYREVKRLPELRREAVAA